MKKTTLRRIIREMVEAMVAPTPLPQVEAEMAAFQSVLHDKVKLKTAMARLTPQELEELEELAAQLRVVAGTPIPQATGMETAD